MPVLVAILLLSAWLRLPGLSWGDGLPDAPAGFTLHPDEPKYDRQVRQFHEGPTSGHVYVAGWAAHGLVVAFLADALAGFGDLDLVAAFRRLSFLYGLLTIALVAVIGRTTFRDPELGLWASAFLGLSGLHAINSHFGTPDAAAAFTFTLTIAAAFAYSRTRGSVALVAMCVAAGAGLALKVQVGVLPVVALACVTDRRPWRRLLQASALVIVSFEAMSLFAFFPRDLIDVALKMDTEVVRQTRATYRFAPGRPLRGLVPALGLGVFPFFAAGAGLLALRGHRLVRERGFRAWLESPWAWFLATFATHVLMLASIRAQSSRQATVLMPTACLVAARGVVGLRRGLAGRSLPGRVTVPVVAAAMAYQVLAVGEIESMFRRDPRIAASRWLSAHVDPGERVTAYFHYSKIPGDYELVEYPADWVVTTSLEYERYLGKTDPSRVLRGQGMERLRFWNRLFDGELDYDRVQEFDLRVRVPEFRWATAASWYDAEQFTFVPTSVVIFRRRDAIGKPSGLDVELPARGEEPGPADPNPGARDR